MPALSMYLSKATHADPDCTFRKPINISEDGLLPVFEEISLFLYEMSGIEVPAATISVARLCFLERGYLKRARRKRVAATKKSGVVPRWIDLSSRISPLPPLSSPLVGD